MAGFRQVTEAFYVSPQIETDDLAQAKARGITMIVNNRPDGESADQPSSAEMETAAKAQGLDYIHIPIVGRPTAAQARATIKAAAGKDTLAFCRSGTRSITAWALGQLETGALSRADLVRLAAGAGYDLSAVLSS